MIMENKPLEGRILGGLWGAIVGDALGVPVEFTSREERKRDPVTDLRGFGAHHQPPGTWSDDSSLILCTVESLLDGFDLNDLGQRFVRWYREGYWTPCGKAFGIGGTTRNAIIRLSRGANPETAGDDDENCNGNGSLMRILPVALRFAGSSVEQLLYYVHQASSLTHRHLRSQMACGFYCLTAASLLQGSVPLDAYRCAIEAGGKAYTRHPYSQERAHFQRLLSGAIHQLPEPQINSGFYVIDTLEASLWCLINSSSFEEAVLKAVNLGGDTDTTGCVTGGLAGIYYGIGSIPRNWMEQLARAREIEILFAHFSNKAAGFKIAEK
jgi:ADP-ribosylglycohydrolase